MADRELVSGRPVYRYYLAWTISGNLALELNFQGVSWSRQVRKAGTFSGTVFFPEDVRLAEAYWGTMPGKMSLYVTRNGKPIWGGMIARRSYDAATRLLQVDAVGFEAYLYRRLIWHDTVQSLTIDQYQVVRNLIAFMQTDFYGVATTGDRAHPHPDSANIGLTVDSRNSGKHQDTQTWLGSELQNFGDAIEGFSNNLGGFEYNIEVDWNLDKDQFTKKLVFRDTPPSQMPDGVTYVGPKPGLDENFFEFPGNIIGLSYEDTTDEAATRFWVTGGQPESTGDTEAVDLPTPRGQWENEAYFSTQWPIFETIESSAHSNVSQESTLDSYAKSYGNRKKPPIPAWTVAINGAMNPQVDALNPGDWCRMVVTDPFLSQSIESSGILTKVITKRIAAFSVTVPDTEQTPETVTLTLVDESDAGAL